MSSKAYKAGEQKNNRTLSIVLITGIIVALCAGVALAGNDLNASETPEQIESLNAVMEQAFRDIPQSDEKVAQSLVDKVSTEDRVPVIVRLRESEQPYGFFSDKKRQRSEIIADLQTTALSNMGVQTLSDEAALHVKRFNILPAMALWVDASELGALKAHPNVIDIVEDIPVPPTLWDSVPLIGGDWDGTFSGFSGQGQTVAIIDTGVDKYHPMLSGKVVSEACFSSYYGASGIYPLCPGGATESTKNNSGLNCHASIAGCEHGTHVAGIAAGSHSDLSGVAQDASIIAIQVFTQFERDADCPNGAPCALSYPSDQIKGLEEVYALRNTYSIAAVNMSLGGGEKTSFCNDDVRKPIIDTLRAVGIATVVASGNDSYTNAMGAPACIDSAISVGNTTKWDTVAASSNSAYLLDLLAPGTDIQSALPDGHGGELTGTSMAAPHVAGAWAVIKQARPNASVDEVLAALRSTGVPVVDTRYGAGSRVTPRINVQAALESMACYVDWDLDGDCDVDKEDASLLKLQQKEEKTYFKILFKAQQYEIKHLMGWYYNCGAGYDFNGNCVIDKEDAKILKYLQKLEKAYYKDLHKSQKTAMKAALKHQYH